MKRGMAGRTRRGPPPVPRQRGALRVVQLTLLAVALVLGVMALRAWKLYQSSRPDVGTAPPSLGEVVALAGFASAFAVGGALMGLRIVKGPEPPSLE